MKSNNDVKSHYEKAAENRNQRLQTKTPNASRVNHQHRFRIINQLLRKIGPVQNGIDIGTGTGVWAKVLTDNCEKVIGIDFAEQNIKIARSNATENDLSDRFSYTLGDARRLENLSESNFDIATHISVLQHLPDHGQALQRVNDILRKDGYLIILVHNRRCVYDRNLISLGLIPRRLRRKILDNRI